MHKISIKSTTIGDFLNCELGKGQQLNIREMELFTTKKLSFALPFNCSQVNNEIMINFDLTGKISLKEYLRVITNKQKFFQVVATFIKVLKECEENKLFSKNILFDFNYIFVDIKEKEVKFPYIPIMDFQNTVDIQNILKEIAFSSVFASMENNDYVKKYLDYFRKIQKFSLVEFEVFIKELSGGLYKDNESKSGPLEAQPEVSDILKCTRCGTILTTISKFCAKCGQAVPLEIINGASKKQTKLVFIPNINPALKVDIRPNLEPIAKSVTENFGGTTLLGEDSAFGTTVLSPEQIGVVTYPYLIRVKSDEKILLDKPAFRIGKEKSYVDYFVSDNGAVSRSHADIITKGNEYFIIDHNSTNKTYLNGVVINPKIETKLEDEIKIKLGNEEFVFHLNKML